MSDGDDCSRGHNSGLRVWTTCLPSLVRALPVHHQAIQQTFLMGCQTNMSEIKVNDGHLLVNILCCHIGNKYIYYIYKYAIHWYTYMCVQFNNTESSVSDQYRMRFAGLIWLFGGDTVGHLLNLDKSINTINRCVYCCTYHCTVAVPSCTPTCQP